MGTEVEKSELVAVPSVDLSRYAGKWYEIARLPTRFEKDCAGDVTATYSLEADGEIKVVNECRQADGTRKRAEGTARRADPQGPTSKLEVSFTSDFLHFLPFVWADYWVIDLDPEYRFAAVGEPDRKYLWILSRTPHMDEATYQTLVARLAARGYDVGELVRTAQGGG